MSNVFGAEAATGSRHEASRPFVVSTVIELVYSIILFDCHFTISDEKPVDRILIASKLFQNIDFDGL